MPPMLRRIVKTALSGGSAYHVFRLGGGIATALILLVLAWRWDWAPGALAAPGAMLVALHALYRILRPGGKPIHSSLIDATVIGGSIVLTQVPIAVEVVLITALVIPAATLYRGRVLGGFLVYVSAWVAADAVAGELLDIPGLTPSQEELLSTVFLILFVPIIGGLSYSNRSLNRRLQQSQSRFRSLVRHNSDVIVVVDDHREILYATPSMETLTTIPPDDLRDTSFDLLLEAEDAAELAEVCSSETSTNRTVIQLNLRMRHPEDRLRHIAATVTDLRDDPAVGGWVLNLHDETERVRAQERLEELVRSKDRFLAAVAHELRTPLTGVSGVVAMLRDPGRPLGEREYPELLDLASRQCSELAGVIDDLLVAARTDVGGVGINLESIMPSQLVEETLGTLEPVQRSRVRVRSDGAAIVADRMRLRHALRNLIVEALARTSGEVVFEVTEEADRVQLIVVDSGEPIPEEDFPHLFDPALAFRGSQRRPARTSLRLATAAELTRLMHGQISYQRHQDQNRFAVLLPVSAEASDLAAS